MPDGGSYIYSGDPENRAWFRQTKVHQTLTLDEKNSKYAPKLLKWEPGKTNDILVVENGSYNNLIHRRSVFFVDKRYFIIVDDTLECKLVFLIISNPVKVGREVDQQTDCERDQQGNDQIFSEVLLFHV